MFCVINKPAYVGYWK